MACLGSVAKSMASNCSLATYIVIVMPFVNKIEHNRDFCTNLSVFFFELLLLLLLVRLSENFLKIIPT